MHNAIPSAAALLEAAHAEKPLMAYHALIKSGSEILNQAFEEGADIEALVHARAEMIDALITHLWQEYFSETSAAITLVAVGGYGRGELHPHSDVDIMLLIASDDVSVYGGKVEEFITLLWDLGLDIGHSVRTLDDVTHEATQDITVITNIMEARWLAGDTTLFQQMQNLTANDQIWPIQDFYKGKLAEQEGRYKKFDDHAYRLEPNIKDGPGGLRDIQNIAWVAKRYHGVSTLKAIQDLGFLTEQETEQLLQGRALLWRIRWGLHVLAGRGENRLLFDLQRKLAELFGYQDEPEQQNLAVETFMQEYYRTVIRLERLNEMLLHLLRESIFPPEQESIQVINERFQVRNGYLDVADGLVFQDTPSALLEVFQLMQKHHELEGVSAQTIRHIREHRELINDEFRNDPGNQKIFLSLMSQPVGVTREFRRMNRYGILARYLPEFGHLVGRMQFDLFHIYTVDQHTIAVLGNSRIFTIDEGRQRFPKATEIYHNLEDPQLLHLGALFHDIGKGHGGDHSEIGEKIAIRFCREHNMSKADTKMVAWLVKNHLLMSMTTQRKDISDPQVIQDFAQIMGDQQHLDYLYLLTIADINGTNPTLWTNWKESLLQELYNRTTRALRRGATYPLDAQEILEEKQEKALALLEYSSLTESEISTLWLDFPNDYFMRHSSDEIAWQSQAILRSEEEEMPLVKIRERSKRGGTPLFIYSEASEDFFAHAAITLDRIGLSVMDARIISTHSGKALDTFVVLDRDNQAVSDKHRIDEITLALHNTLQDPESATYVPRQRIPRQLKQFNIPTRVELSSTADNKYTIIEILTADRPGILAHIGEAFIACDVRVHNAKINTIGEQVDDIFYITDEQGAPLSDPQQIEQLIEHLYRFIDADREQQKQKA